jgi:hypothetical protein
MTDYPYKYQDSNVRFIYIKDSKNPKRVATVSYVRVGDKLLYAWALNRTTRGRHDMWPYDSFGTDSFSKKTGRKIALGRIQLERSRRELAVVPEESYTQTIFSDITRGPVDHFHGVPRPDTMSNVVAPDKLVELVKQALEEYARRDEATAGKTVVA